MRILVKLWVWISFPIVRFKQHRAHMREAKRKHEQWIHEQELVWISSRWKFLVNHFAGNKTEVL